MYLSRDSPSRDMTRSSVLSGGCPKPHWCPSCHLWSQRTTSAALALSCLSLRCALSAFVPLYLSLCTFVGMHCSRSRVGSNSARGLRTRRASRGAPHSVRRARQRSCADAASLASHFSLVVRLWHTCQSSDACGVVHCVLGVWILLGVWLTVRCFVDSFLCHQWRRRSSALSCPVYLSTWTWMKLEWN